MRNFRDLIEKKMNEKEFMNEDEKGIMGDVLGEFKPKGGLGDRLGKMSEVSVIADDEEGLKEGLDEAQNIVEDMPMEEMTKEPMSPEEIQMKIEELQTQIDELRAQLPEEAQLPDTEEGEELGEDYEMDDYEF